MLHVVYYSTKNEISMSIYVYVDMGILSVTQVTLSYLVTQKLYAKILVVHLGIVSVTHFP